MNKLFLLIISFIAAITSSAQGQYPEIDYNMVIDELKNDTLTERSINMDLIEQFEYKSFYVDDVCIVHIQHSTSGVQNAAIVRYYKFRNNQWVFQKEDPYFMDDCEQLSRSLFHVFTYKGSFMYGDTRHESVMRYDNYEMVPVFSYDGYDEEMKLLNAGPETKDAYIGKVICIDNEISDIVIENDTIKSYKLTHTIKKYNKTDEGDDQFTTIVTEEKMTVSIFD